jgi:uncharacterized protein YndB with AHSA1/START domain
MTNSVTDTVQISAVINVPADKVWAALTTPEIIKSYFFGANVETDWKPGSPITWTGAYKGKPFQDKGQIREFAPPSRLSMTHWSPMSGLPDIPANYHTVTYALEPDGNGTKVTLTQHNLTGTPPEKAKESWQPILAGLKKTLEH